jgi:DNA-directed RNA polymerase subunit RPC12/RpoP
MSAISFFCVVCGHAMRADFSLAGAVVECERCERSVPVPGYPKTHGEAVCAAAFAPEILSMDVNFLCGACQVRLVADARWEGKEFDCPKCQQRVRVPWWSRRGGSSMPGLAIARAYESPEAPVLTAEEIHFLTGALGASSS